MSPTVLTADAVPGYLAAHPEFARDLDLTSLSVHEVGDGNLNQVFLARDAQGRSIALKQSLPYLRLFGEAAPLDQDRIYVEARGYEAARRFSPDTVVDYFGLDAENRVIGLEDLSAWSVWRRALNEGRVSPGVGDVLGRHVARVAFGTSVFGLDSAEYLAQLGASPNPELERITLDYVFSFAYRDVDTNSWHPSLTPTVLALREPSFQAEVAELKFAFTTHAEAVLHGDLHSGSVFVPPVDAPLGTAPAKVFDLEFGFIGPVAFDLGAWFGNVLIAQARAAVLGRPADFQLWLGALIGEGWAAFEREFRALWPSRVDPSYTDGFLERWLQRTWAHAIGFAGIKAIRRIVVVSKVSDIESLEGAQHVVAAQTVLDLARRWVEQRELFDDPAALAEVTRAALPGPVPIGTPA